MIIWNNGNIGGCDDDVSDNNNKNNNSINNEIDRLNEQKIKNVSAAQMKRGIEYEKANISSMGVRLCMVNANAAHRMSYK